MGFPIVVPALGTQFLLGAYARLRRGPVKYECPTDYMPEVDVVIPAYGAAKRIPYALASLAEQTYSNIGKITVVDDGSKDKTSETAKLFGEELGLDLEIIRREKSQGKTPSIKQITRNGKSDKLFVFDEDTILAPNYIERVRVPHYNEKVACSFGIVRPLTRKQKSAFYMSRIEPLVNKLQGTSIQDENDLLGGLDEKKGFVEDLRYYSTKWPVEKYRRGLYASDQYFMRDSQLRLFGTTLFPVGCGVMYDREKLKTIFDDFERTLGDNLTTSEDIFVGFGFCNKGLVNAQVKDTFMITTEPHIKRLPYQSILWGSSFIQSAYYFGDMTRTFRKKDLGLAALPQPKGKTEGEYKAISPSAYPVEETNYRQPLGWFIAPPLIEKISYPVVLISLAYFLPEFAVSMLLVEFGIYMLSTYTSVPDDEKDGLISSLLVSEIVRLPSLFLDTYMMGKFAYDVARGKRDWRK
jgi:glycosyltransferase involved in cell wall biosynthesis